MNANLLKELRLLLPQALGPDRPRLLRTIVRLDGSAKGRLHQDQLAEKLHQLEQQLKESIKKRTMRRENRPHLNYNTELPIFAHKDEIIKAIIEHQVVVVAGETGSGKSTQIPKLCLEAGRGVDAMVGCTQPRRISATAVAHRIAAELGEEVGRSVGYKIRFKDRTHPDAFIKIMTDGILLAETLADRYLNAYDTIIVDEAHERSLNIDFILGILKTLLPKRSDLKVIITSATIDTQKFADAFAKAPVIEVLGHMYPVALRYVEADADEKEEQIYVETALKEIVKLQHAFRAGDILVFMPTEKDIHETCESLQGRLGKEATILPLYARLSSREQKRIFSPSKKRKIIVATNVAETSITIPGIKYVIDTGLARVPRYSPRTRTTSLPVVPISRSSADQRKGRCGRVAAGVCMRLFSEADYQTRPLYTPPEILRANLAEVILRMIALKLGDMAGFPFVDRPAPRHIQDGFNLLYELGAISRKQESKKGKTKQPRDLFRLTANGKVMARIPLDPRLARMLIEASRRGCAAEMAVIASALSIQDPRRRPLEQTQAADQMHAAFNDPASDFLSLLNIWHKYHANRDADKRPSQNIKAAKHFCKTNYLSYRRMREWQDIHKQISAILSEQGFKPEGISQAKIRQSKIQNPKSFYASMHKSILSGFLANIGLKKEKNIFQAAKGREAMIFPGSGLFNTAGTWVVAAEMVATNRLYARTVANIDSRWLEELGADQCKYAYANPHWDSKLQAVMASEQVSLFGLIIVSKRSVLYGKIDPRNASEIFIREALIAGRIKEPLPFGQHNQRLIAEIRDIENRLRRRDLLISEDEMFQFYQQRIKGVYELKTLKKLIQERGGDGFLKMTRADLMRYDPDEKQTLLFPDRIRLGRHYFKCKYNFAPENADDGVTVEIPIALAPVVEADALDWLVPGLLAEKIATLIRNLPKGYRKKLFPIAEHVAVIMHEIAQQDGPLLTALGRFVYARFGLDIPAAAWSEEMLPKHLRMRIMLKDPNGREVSAGRDKAVLKHMTAAKIEPDEFESLRKQWEKSGITRWDFGDLPQSLTLAGRTGTRWLFYPALKLDAKFSKQVKLCLVRQREEALDMHMAGVARLYANHFAKDLKILRRNLKLTQGVAAEYFGGKTGVEKKLYAIVIKELFCRNIRKEADFYTYAEAIGRQDLFKRGAEKRKGVEEVLTAHHAARKRLSELDSSDLQARRKDLARLIPENFMELYKNERLAHLGRYIKTISIRAERGMHDLKKDQKRAAQLKPYLAHLERLLKAVDPRMSAEKGKAIEDFFWLVEEFKVSLFAQELKTAIPVSPKRLDAALKAIERMR